MTTLKQQCPLVLVWLTWLGLPALTVVVGLRAGWAAGGLILLVGIMAQVGYLRAFPHLSQWLGYGSVADQPAERGPALPGRLRVRLYTAGVCPFCPLVRERLRALQRHLVFELEEVDVTFRPELVRQKGFRSVPVLEAGGKSLVGNATSAELASFLAKAVALVPGR